MRSLDFALGLLTATFQPACPLFLLCFHSTAKLLSNSVTGQKEANCGTEPIIPKLWVFHFAAPIS